MWPIDSIVEKPANGYFLRDLLIFNGLNAGGFASKGFIFEPPDLNNAQIGELNEFQDKLSILLASLSDNQRLQVQCSATRTISASCCVTTTRRNVRRTLGRAAPATNASPATGAR